MFTFVSLMAIGAFIGYPLRHKKLINQLPFLIHLVVCLLLFLLGVTVGLNKLIISNLTYFCEQAIVISLLSIVGSIFASILVYQFFFKKGVRHEK